MPRNLIPICVILGFAGLAYFLAPEPDSPEVADDPSSFAAQDVAERKTTAPQESTLEEIESATIQRIEIESPVQNQTNYSAPVADGILVTVVDDSGNSLPGAEVTFLDLGVVNFPMERVSMANFLGAEMMFTLMGDRYLSNDSGQVRVPRPTGSLVLAGSTRTYFHAQAWRDSSFEEVILKLSRVSVLPVRVIDEGGAPVAGIMVSLSQREEGEYGGVVAAHTNLDGYAYLKITGALKLELAGEENIVALNTLSPNPVQADVDLANLPETAIELIAPPTGSIEVVGIDLEGKPIADGAAVFLSSLTREGNEEEWRRSGSGLPGQFRQGKMVFPHVALRLQLSAESYAQDYSELGSIEGPGPQRIGEHVLLTLSQEESKERFLVGRILNKEGMVAKNLTLRGHLIVQTASGENSSQHSIRTDGEGKFRLQLFEDEYLGTKSTLTVVMHKTKRKARRIAVVDYNAPIETGDNDFGDFVVLIPPHLGARLCCKPQRRAAQQCNGQLRAETVP